MRLLYRDTGNLSKPKQASAVLVRTVAKSWVHDDAVRTGHGYKTGHFVQHSPAGTGVYNEDRVGFIFLNRIDFLFQSRTPVRYRDRCREF